MTAFGNAALAGALLCLLGLLHAAVLTKGPGGDAGVGQAFVILLWVGGLVVCFAGVTFAAGRLGGFDWLGGSTGVRVALAAAWFALAVLGVYLYPSAPLPRVLRMAGAIALPLCLLAWGAVHLNAGLGRALPSGTPRALTLAALALSALPLALHLFGQGWSHVAALSRHGELDSFQKGLAEQIEAHDVRQGIATLLVHTPRGRHPLLREKALAKIKSRPDWQDELVRLLKTEAAPEVLGFLSANEVDDPARFAAAIDDGLRQQAQDIRAQIRESNHPSNLYAGLRQTEARLALEVADKFQRQGVDYRAAVFEMRRAFDEPSGYPTPAFEGARLIDQWLARTDPARRRP